MLIQLLVNDIRYNVYIESEESNILTKVSREDRGELQTELTRCVTAWLVKLKRRYGKVGD